MLLISNSTYSDSRICTTKTGTTCYISCDTGTLSLSCQYRCVGRCKDPNRFKMTRPTNKAPNAENLKGIDRNVIEMSPSEKALINESLNMPAPKWSKMFNLSGLVTDIYISNDGKIPVAKIIKFLKKSKGSFSKADKEYYGEIIFTDLKKEISAISDNDWKVIENSFSNLTKEQIMSRKNEDLLLKNIQDSALTLPSNKRIIEKAPPIMRE